MFSDELKAGTMQVHTGLEKKLVARIKKIKSIDDYVQLLKLMYGYYKPLQEKISLHHNNSNDDFFSLRTADSILNDLSDLQHTGQHNHIPLCEKTPEVNTPASSLGALYVTEGSTLGGQIITKMIAKQLNLHADKGFSFFNAYGADTHKKWESFKHQLNHPRDENEKKEMMNAAIETFSTFNDWITDNERN